MITVHNFQASYGDTFLVSIEAGLKSEINILIDCGKGFSSNAQLKVAAMGQNNTHKIDRFIITHFDDDHIAGLYSFLEENGDATNPNIIQIEQIWLNTFRHLQFSKRNPVPLTAEEISRLELFKSGFHSPDHEKIEGEIGAKQALPAGRLIYEKDYNWNTDFNGEACIAFSRIKVSDNVYLHLLTPTVDKLQNIEADFISELKRNFNLVPTKEKFFDDAYELYIKNGGQERKKESVVSSNLQEISIENMPNILSGSEYDPDTRAGNGSSISFILETPTEKLLFLADAHAEDVISSLQKMFPERTGPLIFDAIKVAHHGSFRNNKPELFEIIDSEKFIFSTNGKHPSHVHPDVATIAHIITRPLPDGFTERTLYFNHEFIEKQKHLESFRDEKLQEKYHYKISMDREIKI